MTRNQAISFLVTSSAIKEADRMWVYHDARGVAADNARIAFDTARDAAQALDSLGTFDATVATTAYGRMRASK